MKIEAQERDGSLYEIEAEGYEARAILHEIDHLNGVLFESKIIRVVDLAELGAQREKVKTIEIYYFYGDTRFFGSDFFDASAEGYDVSAVVTQPDRPVEEKEYSLHRL